MTLFAETNSNRAEVLALYNVPPDASDDVFLEVYLRSHADYISRVKQFHRAQGTKQAWRKHRFSFEKGIKRFHRNNVGRINVRDLAQKLKDKWNSRSQGEGVLLFQPYEEWAFVRDLTVLESLIAEDGGYFRFEETYAEYWAYLVELQRSIAAVKQAALTQETITHEQLEPLAALVTFSDTSENPILEEISAAESLTQP